MCIFNDVKQYVLKVLALFGPTKELSMDLVTLLNNLIANINALQLQLADAQVSADALAKAKFDEGFAAGVASVTGGGFTQADIDAAVATAVAPLITQVAALQVQVDGIPAQILAAIEAFKVDALAKMKAEEMNLELILAPAPVSV